MRARGGGRGMKDEGVSGGRREEKKKDKKKRKYRSAWKEQKKNWN